MFSVAYKRLLHEMPEARDDLRRLLEHLDRVFSDRGSVAVIEEIAEKLSVSEDVVGTAFAKLVRMGLLEICYQWMCPTTHAVIAERGDLRDLPDFLDRCDYCEEPHFLSEADIGVVFVPARVSSSM